MAVGVNFFIFFCLLLIPLMDWDAPVQCIKSDYHMIHFARLQSVIERIALAQGDYCSLADQFNAQ